MTIRAVRPPTDAELEAARAAVRDVLVPTPLIDSPRLGARALLKLESAQPTGSFKVRGAVTAMAALPPGEHVVTASTGNHAVATAWAARRAGRTATILVPRTASAAKLAGLRRIHDRIEEVGTSFDDAERRALELGRAGARYLSAYNEPLVIAGQSTIGAELDALEGPLTVLVQVGGGGLLAGVALWARTRPDVRLVGVEAAASTAFSASLAAGRVVHRAVGPTLADGAAGNLEAGCVTVGICADRVDEMATVSEDEIEAAMRFLAAEHGVVAEGAGAVATAALLAGTVTPRGRAVALVSGRNVALPVLARVLAGPRQGADA